MSIFKCKNFPGVIPRTPITREGDRRRKGEGKGVVGGEGAKEGWEKGGKGRDGMGSEEKGRTGRGKGKEKEGKDTGALLCHTHFHHWERQRLTEYSKWFLLKNSDEMEVVTSKTVPFQKSHNENRLC